MGFMHIFEHNRPFGLTRKGQELLIVKGLFGRAAEI
jgi:hypothetical protein